MNGSLRQGTSEDGESSYPIPLFLDDHKRTRREHVAAFAKNDRKPSVHGCGSLVIQPKKDDTRIGKQSQRQQVAEVEVEGEHHAALDTGLVEYVAILRALEPLLAEMHDLVPALSEPRYGSQSRRPCLQGSASAGQVDLVDFFVRQEGRVTQCFGHVFGLQVRVFGENLGFGHAVGEKVEDMRYGDSHAPNASTAAHDTRVERDSLELCHRVSLSRKRSNARSLESGEQGSALPLSA